VAAAQHVLDDLETADCWYWHELTASRSEDMNSAAARYQHYLETTSYSYWQEDQKGAKQEAMAVIRAQE
jgi:predicted solute-binding protein